MTVDTSNDPADEAADERSFRLEVTFGATRFAAEGPGDLVLKAYDTFIERLPQESEESEADGEGDGGSEAVPETPAASGKAAAGPPMPLPKFLEAHPPKNNFDCATVIVTWAKRNKQENGLTQSEIVAYWKQSGQKPPKNPGRDIHRAVTEGWLDPPKDHKYVVNQYGEKHVDGDLKRKEKS